MTPRKGINPRTKGKTFERRIAKLLTPWYGQEVKRVPTSGAWDKVRFAGDLYSDEKFPLCAELKNRETWCERDFWTGSKEIDSWWEQCYGDAMACTRVVYPVVIFSRNYSPIYILTPVVDTRDSMIPSKVFSSHSGKK